MLPYDFYKLAGGTPLGFAGKAGLKGIDAMLNAVYAAKALNKAPKAPRAVTDFFVNSAGKAAPTNPAQIAHNLTAQAVHAKPKQLLLPAPAKPATQGAWPLPHQIEPMPDWAKGLMVGGTAIGGGTAAAGLINKNDPLAYLYPEQGLAKSIENAVKPTPTYETHGFGNGNPTPKPPEVAAPPAISTPPVSAGLEALVEPSGIEKLTVPTDVTNTTNETPKTPLQSSGIDWAAMAPRLIGGALGVGGVALLAHVLNKRRKRKKLEEAKQQYIS